MTDLRVNGFSEVSVDPNSITEEDIARYVDCGCNSDSVSLENLAECDILRTGYEWSVPDPGTLS